MKDYLESQNIIFEQITPRAVIKEAIASKLIRHGDTWMNALDDRNKMNHTYDLKQFEVVINDIENHYLQCLKELYEKLKAVDLNA